MAITSIAIIWQQDRPNLLVPPWSKPCPHSGIMEGFRLPRNRELACGSPNPSRMEGQTQSDGTAAGGWLPVSLGGCRGVQAGLWGSKTIIWWKGRPNLMVHHGGRGTEAACRGRQKVAVPQAHSPPQPQKESPHDPGVHWDAWRRLGWMPGWPSVVLVGVFFVAAEWFVCCFGCRPDLRRVLDCTVSPLLSRKCRVTTDCRKLTVCQLWLCRNEGQTQHNSTSVPRDPK